jgi:hypothetical protein
VNATLRGTGRIADDVYLLAHHDITGKPLLQPRATGLGLAGALIAELMLAGAVTCHQATLTVAHPAPPPRDELAGQVLGQLAGERETHPVREWLLFLARTAARDVAVRLEAAGYLARGLGWRGVRWVPVDSDAAFAPVTRALAGTAASHTPYLEEVVLAGLADACGLGARLDHHATAAPRRPLGTVVAWLDPSLQELIAATKAAVGAAVLCHRA